MGIIHLQCECFYVRVNNFSKDVADGENYTILLNQLKPDVCSRAPLQERDLLKRAELVLDNAEKIECRKYLTPTALVAGNPKLNLAFVAHLFNTHPGLDPLTEEEAPEIEPFDAEGEREARGMQYSTCLYLIVGIILISCLHSLHPLAQQFRC